MFVSFILINIFVIFILFDKFLSNTRRQSFIASFIITMYGIIFSVLFINVFRGTDFNTIFEKIMSAWQWKSFFVRFVFCIIFMEFLIILFFNFISKMPYEVDSRKIGGEKTSCLFNISISNHMYGVDIQRSLPKISDNL